MADKKISQLTGASTPLAGTEVLPIVQSGSTVKVSSDDLTVKNVRSNATSGILQIAGPAVAATRTMTVPDANFSAARIDAAQNFTGNNTFDTSTLAIDATNDRVGVGLTNPSVRFHVQGVATAISGTSKATVLIDDTTAYAANVGGAITLRGKYNAAGDYVAGGYIQAQKTNATDGNDSFDVVLGTRENGSGAAEALRLTDARDVKVTAGNLVVGTAGKGIADSAGTQQLYVNTTGIGVGAASAAEKFEVTGNIKSTGTIKQTGATQNFTNLTNSNQDWNIDATETVFVTLTSVDGQKVQFILALSWDNSNLNVRATNLSGATVGTSGVSATVQPGDGRTYTISRNGSTGKYQWQSSSLATGTTTIKYFLAGAY